MRWLVDVVPWLMIAVLWLTMLLAWITIGSIQRSVTRNRRQIATRALTSWMQSDVVMEDICERVKRLDARVGDIRRRWEDVEPTLAEPGNDT